jgi:hypothetical protein
LSNKIKLKRSSSPSSVPQLVDLSLGELAVNTFDGKIFFKKDDGSESIGSIVTTNAQITGSIELIGDVTASSFLGSNAELNSLLVTDFIELTGSLNIVGSTTQIGTNNLIGNTTLSGSIIISGSESPITPSIQIYGDTQHSGVVRFNPISRNIDTSISASYMYVSGSTDDLYFSQNGRGYSNVTRLRWLEGNLYTGLLNGGVISATLGSQTYQISSGSGIIVNMNASLNDNPYPEIQYLNWGNLTGNISSLTSSYQQAFLAIDNTGNILQQGTPFDETTHDNDIQIGLVLFQNGSTINGFKTQPHVAYGGQQQTDLFVHAFGPLKLSGYTLAPSGSSTRSLVVGSGTAFSIGSNYEIDPNNPSYAQGSGTNVSKIFRYRQSGSAWVYDTNGGAGYTTIDPTQYANVTAGTLDSVSNNKWTIQRVFWFPNSVAKAIVVYYGNVVYDTQADANANIPYESFVEAPNTAANAIYLGAIVIKGDGVFTTDADYSIRPGGLFRQVGGSGGGSISSLALSGLSDVTITSPTNKQPIAYNTSTAKWENISQLSSNITGSLFGNASTANTASYVTPLIQNVQITGSLNLNGSMHTTNAVTSSLFLINNDSPSSDIFLVKVGGNPKIKINQQGTFVINESATLPTPETGAIVVSGSNFFVYL